jgi:hypothetical protein
MLSIETIYLSYLVYRLLLLHQKSIFFPSTISFSNLVEPVRLERSGERHLIVQALREVAALGFVQSDI